MRLRHALRACRGDSFHFAHRYRNESLKESIRRHEHFLALKLGLDKSHKARHGRRSKSAPRRNAQPRRDAQPAAARCNAAATPGAARMAPSARDRRGEAQRCVSRSRRFCLGRTQVVDIGCGIGGPLRAISAFSGAAVTGVNNNEYQARARAAAGRLGAPKPR